jgi:hypothetical protein
VRAQKLQARPLHRHPGTFGGIIPDGSLPAHEAFRHALDFLSCRKRFCARIRLMSLVVFRLDKQNRPRLSDGAALFKIIPAAPGLTLKPLRNIARSLAA